MKLLEMLDQIELELPKSKRAQAAIDELKSLAGDSSGDEESDPNESEPDADVDDSESGDDASMSMPMIKRKGPPSKDDEEEDLF